MGLDITVGILSSLINSDAEGFEHYQALFARVNQALIKEGLAEHHEPEEPGHIVPWSCRMWNYGGLHYLRRIAAYLWADYPLPSPGTEADIRAPMTDPIIDKAYALLYPSDHPFAAEHLLFHSDAGGFYLPLDFAEVIYPDAALHIPGEMIGSVIRLQAECQRLATALAIPANLEYDVPLVWDSAAHQGEAGAAPWQRYGIETFTCLRLLKACETALESGCALVFH